MDTATWFNNKLTSLIYDGDRAVDWTQAKMIEGSSANKQDEVAGRGQERRIIRQKKKLKTQKLIQKNT